MTDYQCGSCSYESNDLDELRLHRRETGHSVTHGAEATGAAEHVELSAGSALDGRTAAEIVLGVLSAGVIVALALQTRGAKAAAAGLMVQLARGAKEKAHLAKEVARLAAENAYLKSASGAGKTLVRYRSS
ncbi:hypothetical protein ACWDRR_33175 [Kitasatospora sp. NPDC003701]